MKSNSNLGKKILMAAALLVLAGWVGLAAAPADQPLTKDDITLLLFGELTQRQDYSDGRAARRGLPDDPGPGQDFS